MATKVEKTGEVRVIDDAGSPLKLDIFTTFILYRPLDGAEQWIPGSKAYKLNGMHCNPIDENTWQVVTSEKVLRRA